LHAGRRHRDLRPAIGLRQQLVLGIGRGHADDVGIRGGIGVAALLLARNPKFTPDQVRSLLIKSARYIVGNKRDVGAGLINALAAVDSVKNKGIGHAFLRPR
jgi:hypothetical protein